MTKKIYFNCLPENPHTIWKEIINHPPKGYDFIFDKPRLNYKGKLDFIRKNKFVLFLYHKFLERFINPIWLNEKFLFIPKEASLIYSADTAVSKKFPWVCDTEHVNSFAGHNKMLLKKRKGHIEEMLASPYCKKIMPFTNYAKRTIERELDISRFKDKIEVVHFAADVPKIRVKKDPNEITLIFVGTANYSNPTIFNLKGGRETIEAFKILKRKYSNLRLKIVSNIPQGIDTSIDGIEVLPLMDRESLYKVYSEADIFLVPSYIGFGMVFVEAMGCSLPIVTTNIFALPEGVEAGKNGFLIKIKNERKFEYGAQISEFEEFADYIYKNNKDEIIKGVVNAVSKLVENPKLRKQMGIASRKKFEKEFSIKTRNKKLKQIFDEAIGNRG